MNTDSSSLRATLLLSMGGLVAAAAHAETVVWQIEGEVQGLAVPSTTQAYFPRPLASGEKVTFRLVVDAATPVLFPLPTEALYPGAIKSATAFGTDWSITPASFTAATIEVRNEEPPGRDAVFFNAMTPSGQGQVWYSFQPTLFNIDFAGGPGPLSSVAIPTTFSSLADWNGSYFYFSARRDDPGQPLDGATYIGRLTAVSVARDSDGDGILDPADNCPGSANADQVDSNSDGYGDACVHPTVRIPASASVNHFVKIDRNAVIEKGVATAEFVAIGTATHLEESVTLGRGTMIGDFSELERSVRIGASSVVGSDVEMERSSMALDQVKIGDHTEVGQGAVICPRAKIGNSARILRYALVQTGAVVAPGAVVRGRATAPSPAMCQP